MVAAADSLLLGLAAIVVLGMLAQWIAWRTRLPSILLLLVFGFLAGPEVAGLIDADLLFGESLLPIVSLSVAVLLFEGGLTLRLSEVGKALKIVALLVTVGAGITWALTALAAHHFLGYDPAIATLIGAVLIVTGPTVVGPLLRQIRPTGPVGSILRWEGILIDPVGAVTAVLVFEAIASHGGTTVAGIAVAGVLKTIFVGGGLGAVVAWLLMALLRRHWVPDFLHSTAALAATVGAFVAANAVQHDAGLLTVTLMGVILANQHRVSVAHILEFKENLRVLIISSLFLLLASRIELADVARVDAGRIAFLAALFLVVRPLTVFACTIGSNLTLRERIFLSCVAPRGIVAAAVASVFALRLDRPEILSTTFIVILGTVAVYGLAAAPLAYRLRLAAPHPQGLLLIGAPAWARDFGNTMQDLGIRVLFVDTNPQNVSDARMAGMPAVRANILAESTEDELDLQGIGRLLALTPNDDVNALAALHYRELFGRRWTYQLAPQEEPGHAHLRGRSLPADHATMEERYASGARFRATKLTEQFTLDAWRAVHGPDALALAAVSEKGEVTIANHERPFAPAGKQTLVALVAETT